MITCYSSDKSNAKPIHIILQSKLDSWLENQDQRIKNWVSTNKFKAKSSQFCVILNSEGMVDQVLVGATDENDGWVLGGLPANLPEGDYYVEHNPLSPEASAHSLFAWGAGSYQFTKYTEKPEYKTRLVCPDSASQQAIINRLESVYLVRDLINMPTEDLGPEDLSNVVAKVAKEFGAKLTQTVGDKLLSTYPSVHMVGKGSSRAPRVLDLRWGRKNQFTVTVVGKGVCFDSGGLDLKPASGMLDMKKDMGGAANALGLARQIMAANLPVNLRLLIPAVENSVSGDSYRPGDIIRSRSGKTIEVLNTDAEGRLILCDVLSDASDEKPNLLVDFATLTGAARVAVGTDISALFTRDDKLAYAVKEHAEQTYDPVWQLPLYKPYRSLLDSPIADIANCVIKSPYGGATTAALFLSEFVDEEINWIHFDIMASNTSTMPGRPLGGEAMGMHAMFSYIKSLCI